MTLPKPGRQKLIADRRNCSTPVLHGESTRSVAPVLRRHSSASNLFFKSKLVPIHPKFGTWGSLKRIARFLWTWPALVCWWMGQPSKWVAEFLRLVAFTALMLPSFLPPLFSYLTSREVIKNVAYGSAFRHQLDVYLPRQKEEPTGSSPKKAPVVIFVGGGAWIIGYKLWAFIIGQLFQRHGILFIAPDYRNFPETTLSGMVDDVIKSVGWVFDNLHGLKGDPNNVTIMGQSAGAHISALAVLEQATRGARARSRARSISSDSTCLSRSSSSSSCEETPRPWRIQDVARWVGISGPYDMMEFAPCIRKRGMPKTLLDKLLEKDYARFSPVRRIRDLLIADPLGIIKSLPPTYLFHGMRDRSVGWDQSEAYAKILQKALVPVQTKYYETKAHTDPILEDPCAGDGAEAMDDLLRLVQSSDSSVCPSVFASQPKLLLKLAKMFNPF